MNLGLEEKKQFKKKKIIALGIGAVVILGSAFVFNDVVLKKIILKESCRKMGIFN